MENLNKMVATSLPDYEDDVPMSDEERDVEDIVMVPLTDLDPTPLEGTGTKIEDAASPTEAAPTTSSSMAGRSSEPATPPREIAQAGSDGRSSGNDPVATPKSTAGSKGSSKLRCRKCYQRHHLRQCNAFQSMPLDQRIRTVVRLQHCSNCLDSGHSLRHCKKDSACRNCRGRHHTLLCPSNTLPSQSNTPRPSAKKFKRPSASNCPSASLTPVNPTQNLAIQPIVTLGPTIIAQLVLNSRRIPVRALLDPCAGNSRICISLVQSLRLQTIPLGPDRFVQCTLASSYNDSQKLLVSARVTELRHIVSPSESASEEIANHYEGMMLADPQFFKAARIVLVLGAEVYPKVMKAQTYSSQGFPWSQLTIFGWIV
ncbi:uncharacterized protein LOC131806570 [Musca domestica]|uniref:Uncharacterized protein LOC131806570 n=1 Tax=Musca domestica TaxID=7370 RepID=A0ABM3VLY1_MUSDO|nr:uncharacterized protein LOC131806570 [Musca domestica]